MDKHMNTAKGAIRQEEVKKKVPGYVIYGLIALAALIVIGVGIYIYFSIATGYVATVGGTKITTSEYRYYLDMQKSNMLQQAQSVDPNINQATFWSTKIGSKTAEELAKDNALESLRQLKIQLVKAKEAKVALSSADIKNADDYYIQQGIVQQMGSGNRTKAAIAFKKQYGISLDDFRKIMLDNTLAQKFQSQEIGKVKLTDADVKTYYDKNPDWYKESSMRTSGEEAVWARHILISVSSTATQAEKDAAKKKAEDIIAKLKGGADFVSLVKSDSQDPGSNTRGGDYVFGKGKMLPEFENSAFNLTPGAYTDAPVLTSAGYHIIQLIEKIGKDQPVSLKCATEYYEYGTGFIGSKLYDQKITDWEKDARFKAVMNDQVYNSIN